MPTKFILPPEQASYSVQDGEETIRVALDGGAGRFRRDILDATSRVRCTWLLTVAGYEYMRAFYKTATKSCSLPFLIDLQMDQVDGLTEHTVHFIPGTMKLTKVAGLSYVVEADLEVVPDIEDEAYNLILIMAFEEFGDDRQSFLDLVNELEDLANYGLLVA